MEPDGAELKTRGGVSETGDGRTGRTRVVAERGTSWRGRFWIKETQTLLIFKTRRRPEVAEL